MSEKIFVVGAGFMGAGIAQTAITAGFEVTLNDMSMELVEKAKAGIEKMLGKSVAKGRMTEADKEAAMARLQLSDKFDAAAEADVIIESVIENAEIKKAVFAKLSEVAKPEAILTTNTSSISIAELSTAVKDPTRFLGMHFFSPVPLMKLLEIVRCLATSDEAIATVKSVGERMGKVCVVSEDSPAFIVNRMLNPMLNEAMCLLETKVASVEDIDAAMKFGLNHPMGPLELTDMVGLDVELAALTTIFTETGDPKYRPCGLLKSMVRLGWLGRKTGRGFYIYHADGTRTVNPDL
ncbi:MAG: 3-hydroxyacyl-CoA dehydrogenase NAD-binding domain-containing protein [Oscillospiraceae bacterium]|nr:3-hydroxyacyl-CoA dehydrogenase NAD-binding domain-containing protein [Oscillospiraceae bacterium]